MRVLAFAQGFLLATALATGATAHDFWIEPSTFHAAPLARVAVELKVGERFAGEPVARKSERIVRFASIDPAGKETALVGLDGGTPAGWLVPREAGLFVLGYRSNAVPIELEAAKFENYLLEEGLDSVIAERKRLGESEKKGIERYSRSVKSFVHCGDTAAEDLVGWDRRMGLTLEVVPLVNPLTLKPGDTLTVEIEYEGQALANALVGCMPKADPKLEQRLRTDEKGRVSFKVAKSGAHLVRVCHMVRAKPETGADWESTWGSLSFETAAR